MIRSVGISSRGRVLGSMKVIPHTVVSTAFAGGLYLAYPCWQMAATAFVAGVLIDVDHVIDYIIEFGVRSNWGNFFRSFSEGQYAKIYIVFHAWEWLFVLGIVTLLTGGNPWAAGLVLGATQHMIFDQLTNGASALGYSILWRWSRGFDPNPAFPHRKTPFHSPGQRGSSCPS